MRPTVTVKERGFSSKVQHKISLHIEWLFKEPQIIFFLTENIKKKKKKDYVRNEGFKLNYTITLPDHYGIGNLRGFSE